MPPSRRFGDSLKVRAEHLAVTAAIDGFLEPRPLWPETQTHGGHEQAFGIGCSVSDFAGILEGASERLFADHMFAGSEGGLGQFNMGAGGGADVDDVDAIVGEEFFEILVGFDLLHVELDWISRI